MNVFEKWTATGILESWEPRSVAHQGVVRNQRKEGEREKEKERERETILLPPLYTPWESTPLASRLDKEEEWNETIESLWSLSIPLSYLIFLAGYFERKTFEDFAVARTSLFLVREISRSKEERKKEIKVKPCLRCSSLIRILNDWLDCWEVKIEEFFFFLIVDDCSSFVSLTTSKI